MNEIDILTNAGLPRATAEMVTALYTMASALAQVAQQHPAAAPPAEAVSGEVIDVTDE